MGDRSPTAGAGGEAAGTGRQGGKDLAYWDFLSLTPGSIHQVTILFSDRGTPATFRNLNGYSSHTYKWYNAKGEYFWVQYHFKTD